MIKLAVIGASYLQEPLIQTAKSMGCETHVFAWKAGDPGEKSADHFYPVSIVEKDEILRICRQIGIDGICTIASDLAAVTVNYVAEQMGLAGNTMETTLVSTNKHLMRERFASCGDPSVKSIQISSAEDLKDIELTYPVIIKPVDRSGSRGIFKVTAPEQLAEAVRKAVDVSFDHKALAEEFASGYEYSVEGITWHGQHHILAITQKYTTGAPGFIETGHLEPALLTPAMKEKVRAVVIHALNSLGIQNSASHSELKIDRDGNIRLIEIGGRMGGDFIGSHLVRFSTGIDYIRAVVDTALGREPDLSAQEHDGAGAVRFILGQDDLDALERLKKEHPEYLYDAEVHEGGEVVDSSTRHGYFLMHAQRAEDLIPYLPERGHDE